MESAIVSGDERLEMGRMEIDNMRASEAEIREKIEAIFLTCTARKSNGDNIGLKEAEGIDIAAIYRRVTNTSPRKSSESEDMGNHSTDEAVDSKQSENADTEPFGRTTGQVEDIVEAASRPYAHEINACMERKLALLADAEAEYKAAVSANREKDQEKRKLHDTVHQAFELAHQCKSVLIALGKEGDTLAAQRRQAEDTLKECEKALDIAAERVGEKVNTFWSTSFCICVIVAVFICRNVLRRLR